MKTDNSQLVQTVKDAYFAGFLFILQNRMQEKGDSEAGVTPYK